MAVTFAMRFDSAKKAAIAAMSQMSSSSKPWDFSTSKSASPTVSAERDTKSRQKVVSVPLIRFGHNVRLSPLREAEITEGTGHKDGQPTRPERHTPATDLHR